MQSFLFGGDTGMTQAELMRRRKAAETKRPLYQPATTGEGLSALGHALSRRIAAGELETDERSGADAYSSAFDGAFGSGPSSGPPPGQPGTPPGARGRTPSPGSGTPSLGSKEWAYLIDNPHATRGQSALARIYLQRILAEEDAKIRQRMVAQTPRARKWLKAADDRYRYTDTGDLVFPDVETQQGEPEPVRGMSVGGNIVNPVTGEMIYQGSAESGDRRIIKGPDGSPYYADDASRVLPEMNAPVDPMQVGPDFKTEQSLRKEFEARPGVGGFREVRDAWNRIQVSRPTAAGDTALIFNYMKMLDPDRIAPEIIPDEMVPMPDHPPQARSFPHQPSQDRLGAQPSQAQSFPHQPSQDRYLLHQPSQDRLGVQPSQAQSLPHQPSQDRSLPHQPSQDRLGEIPMGVFPLDG